MADENGLVGAAWTFCRIAHAGQVRKYTGEPYETHPREVAQRVHEAGGDEVMIAAALLHDVVEDTCCTIQRLARFFPRPVAEMVGDLTDVPSEAPGNRRERKAADRARLAAAGPAVHTIKLADIGHNTENIVAHDPHFSRLYLRECALLLTVLDRGHRGLWRAAFGDIRAGAASLSVSLPEQDRLAELFCRPLARD
ncbi:MAG: HD domain-containing protein [Salinisphaeraceae bacterium]